ncbi:PfkB family carbohydrate kinase [Dactylosporangium sp. NBC_01737]|uniref:PfkB family carbohydrate kinase n=1 Tax=Dactylosporangium sp. NBC_01737 TaxID=2975959 RepID=UPI002E113139|nr:PfkB family carbohydrate kinase [Dactylosporangium sp. NBC_01737]
MTRAGHAVVIGEALVDLLESGDPIVYHPAIGGAPLNVAVGIARLGAPSEFAGSLGDDPWATRILDFLTTSGVGTRGVTTVPGVATTLAVTTFRGIEPTFRFYGEPPSYGLLTDVDTDLVATAGLLYCGSMCLLSPPVLAAARNAWATPGPIRVFDPNVRPVVGVDPAVVAEFAATADLVKLSSADAAALWGESPEQAAARLLALGAGAVVVTIGAEGALVALATNPVTIGAEDALTTHATNPVTTGAEDALTTNPTAPTTPHTPAPPTTAPAAHPAATAPAPAAPTPATTAPATAAANARATPPAAARAIATVRVAAPDVVAVDATGAGDATMAGLSWGILTHGLPTDLAGWERLTRFAVHVAGLVCESRGGAVSMPTLAALRARFPSLELVQ